MQLVHDNYPDISFMDVEEYPYNSAALLNWWMAALRNTSQGAGIQGPDGFEVDHDQGDARSRWSDLILMRDQAHSLGWTFSEIYGSPTLPPYNWHDSAMIKGSHTTQTGLNSDIYTFESWEFETNDPPQTLSEDAPFGSFMQTVKQFRGVGYFPR
jgi:hypothetical protein